MIENFQILLWSRQKQNTRNQWLRFGLWTLPEFPESPGKRFSGKGFSVEICSLRRYHSGSRPVWATQGSSYVFPMYIIFSVTTAWSSLLPSRSWRAPSLYGSKSEGIAWLTWLRDSEILKLVWAFWGYLFPVIAYSSTVHTLSASGLRMEMFVVGLGLVFVSAQWAAISSTLRRRLVDTTYNSCMISKLVH